MWYKQKSQFAYKAKEKNSDTLKGMDAEFAFLAMFSNFVTY